MKQLVLIIWIGVFSLFGEDYETQTPDVLLQEGGEKTYKPSVKSSQVLSEEDAIHKPDPLLESLQKEQDKEPTLLEKIFLQNQDKKQEKHPKKVFKKPLENDEVVTPDPLLDEI